MMFLNRSKNDFAYTYLLLTAGTIFTIYNDGRIFFHVKASNKTPPHITGKAKRKLSETESMTNGRYT